MHTKLISINLLKKKQLCPKMNHKNLKQYSLVERCQSRRADLQRAYIALRLCALVKMKRLCRKTKKSISDYQRELFRKVIERYRQNPPPSTLDVSHHVFCGVRWEGEKSLMNRVLPRRILGAGPQVGGGRFLWIRIFPHLKGTHNIFGYNA